MKIKRILDVERAIADVRTDRCRTWKEIEQLRQEQERDLRELDRIRRELEVDTTSESLNRG